MFHRQLFQNLAELLYFLAIAAPIALAKVLPYGISVLSSIIRGMFFVPRSGSLSPMYWISSWLPELLIVCFYLWVIRLARRRLLGDLAAANPMRFDVRQEVSSAWTTSEVLILSCKSS